MFAFLLILLLFMALPFGEAQVDAVDGVTDLRDYDLSSAMYRLGGGWQVARRQLVLPDVFPDDAPTANIPEWWPRSFDELNTYATYRLKVLTDDTRLLQMLLPEIYMAYNLWINGEYVRGAGIVSENAAGEVPEFEGVLVPLRAENGKVEIVIQASNHNYMRPIMGGLILLGESDSAYSWFFQSRSLYIFALGAFLVGAFYHIALYVLRRKELIYLLFSLLSMICFWRYAIDTNGISNLTGWFSMWGGLADMKVFMTLFFLHGAAVSAFSLYVFDKEWLFRYRFIGLGYVAAGAVAFAVMPWNIPFAPLIVIAVMAPITLIAIYRGARSRVLRESKLMWLLYAALILYCVTNLLQKYFFDHLLFMTGIIADLLLLLTQALILSQQFAEMRDTGRLLEEKNAMLDRLNSMKTEFVHNMSHDFKTPLTVISISVLNAVDMLDTEIDTAEMRESLNNAQREVMQMAQMVDNAMKHASMQENRQSMEPLDLSPLLLDGAETYRTLLERSGNTLILDVPQLPLIYGNADMMLHILSNLLSNANRYTRNGEISISARSVIYNSQPVVKVAVADSGVGVKPELLPHVFERGVSDSGTGLGLSICKSAVESLGGTIAIESDPGIGTVIWFTIPIIERREKQLDMAEAPERRNL